jgi:hypothetical protein
VVIELFTFHFSVTALDYGLRSLIAAERVIVGPSIEAASEFQAHAMPSVEMFHSDATFGEFKFRPCFQFSI